MFAKLRSSFRVVAYALIAVATVPLHAACAQDAPALIGVTADQLKTLLPNAQDLSGFAPTRPLSDRWPQELQGKPAPDGIGINKVQQGAGGKTTQFSIITRLWYSQNEKYTVDMTVRLYSSPQTAHDAILDDFVNIQAVYHEGAFSGSPIGDESWFYYGPTPSNRLVYRFGKVTVWVGGSLTFNASKQGGHEPFPMSSVEAIGNTILMRLARNPELTGVPTQAARVAVNGQQMPARSALLIGKQLYVPVTEFAKAAGWKSQWDAKTGALTLTNPMNKQQPITLAAGSTAVSEKGKARPVSLQSALLKEANQPVMLLDDLLTLTKGRIANRTGNSFRITV